jgi:hypothetical protein
MVGRAERLAAWQTRCGFHALVVPFSPLKLHRGSRPPPGDRATVAVTARAAGEGWTMLTHFHEFVEQYRGSSDKL